MEIIEATTVCKDFFNTTYLKKTQDPEDLSTFQEPSSDRQRHFSSEHNISVFLHHVLFVTTSKFSLVTSIPSNSLLKALLPVCSICSIELASVITSRSIEMASPISIQGKKNFHDTAVSRENLNMPFSIKLLTISYSLWETCSNGAASPNHSTRYTLPFAPFRIE